MTATQIDSTTDPTYQVGDRVHLQRNGQSTPGRISSVHRTHNAVEYVVATDAPDGGMGTVVNVRTTDPTAFLTPARAGGEPR